MKRNMQLIVAVMQLLVQHRCGMLVIEEAQEANLGSAAFSRDFLNFFLRILNWGIPTLIVGNPLAFTELRSHAQDVDRFSEGGWFTMLPEWGPDSVTWKKSWLPGVWQPSLLDQEDAPFAPLESMPGVQDWSSFLWQLTGGLPRQLVRLRAEVMDLALARNESTVTSEFVLQTFQHSSRFSAVAARNRALANHDIKALLRYRDLPIDQLRDYWLKDAIPASKAAAKGADLTQVTALEIASSEALQPDAAAEQKRLIAGMKFVTEESRKARQKNKHDPQDAR